MVIGGSLFYSTFVYLLKYPYKRLKIEIGRVHRFNTVII